MNELIREAFLAGVSTRWVGEMLAPVLGEAPSPQTVSRVARSLDSEVRRFHTRPLSDHHSYLFLDGITLKVKGASGVKKRLVLCAYGITFEGEREIISFYQATCESEAQWEAFRRDLYERGLEGKPLALALVVTDGNPGLHRTLDTGNRLSLCAPTTLLGAQVERCSGNYPEGCKSPALKGLSVYTRPLPGGRR